MTADQYLLSILTREAVDTGLFSPVRGVQTILMPRLQEWAGNALASVTPSGSFAKGTANRSGTDIDLFISLHSTTTATLSEIYETLHTKMSQSGYKPKRQSVSINVRVGSFDVDLVPAKRQTFIGEDHSLFRRKANTWTKTNVATHIAHVRQGGRLSECRILKLWRSQKALEFPSFYLELIAIEALSGRYGGLADNVWTVLQYLHDRLQSARVLDPANTNNVISDDLTAAEKAAVSATAARALQAKTWEEIVV